jgi:hypothetical protein
MLKQPGSFNQVEVVTTTCLLICLFPGAKPCLLTQGLTILFTLILFSASMRIGEINFCVVYAALTVCTAFVHGEDTDPRNLSTGAWHCRCGVEDILLEMDRILRPEGSVIIRDDVDILLNVKAIMDAMQWDGRITDHESSPHEREKILFATKKYWTAPRPDQD